MLRLTFRLKSGLCVATAKVVSSRLVSVGNGATTLPPFESRLQLVEVPHTSEHLLARVLTRGGEPRREAVPHYEPANPVEQAAAV